MGSTRMAFQMTLATLITYISAAPGECSCSAQFHPVCASNGQVFSNECVLRCYNSEKNANLEVEKAGHCDNHFIAKPAEGSSLLQEKSVGGAADVCLFTKDYEERLNYMRDIGKRDLSTEKETSGKPKHYYQLLVILCCIECAAVPLVQLFFSFLVKIKTLINAFKLN